MGARSRGNVEEQEEEQEQETRQEEELTFSSNSLASTGLIDIVIVALLLTGIQAVGGGILQWVDKGSRLCVDTFCAGWMISHLKCVFYVLKLKL